MPLHYLRQQRRTPRLGIERHRLRCDFGSPHPKAWLEDYASRFLRPLPTWTKFVITDYARTNPDKSWLQEINPNKLSGHNCCVHLKLNARQIGYSTISPGVTTTTPQPLWSCGYSNHFTTSYFYPISREFLLKSQIGYIWSFLFYMCWNLPSVSTRALLESI